jgi:hypothetical protein
VIKDRRIRRQPSHKQILDVPLERPSVQEVSGDIVEPDALAQIAELFRRFHVLTSVGCFKRYAWWRTIFLFLIPIYLREEFKSPDSR